MAVTDLTNTTWVFNDNIEYAPGGWRFDAFNGNSFRFSIDFTSVNGNHTTLSGMDKDDMGEAYIYFKPATGISYVWHGTDGWINEAIKTITITGGTDATNADLISWLEANATLQTQSISFKHYYRNTTLIGTGTYKFRPYTVAKPLPKLATPQNVTANGTTVSWDEVANATSYEIFADGTSLGIVEGAITDELAGTWVFNDSLDYSSFSSFSYSYNINFTSNGTTYSELGSPDPGALPTIGVDLCYGSITVYNTKSGWTNTAYQTITITSKLAEVTDGDTLLTWLKSNATKQ